MKNRRLYSSGVKETLDFWQDVVTYLSNSQIHAVFKGPHMKALPVQVVAGG